MWSGRIAINWNRYNVGIYKFFLTSWFPKTESVLDQQTFYIAFSKLKQRQFVYVKGYSSETEKWTLQKVLRF